MSRTASFQKSLIIVLCLFLVLIAFNKIGIFDINITIAKRTADGSMTRSKELLIPNQLQINDIGDVYSIYWRYVNTIQALCRNQTRVGSLRDGGKEVCTDESYKPSLPCLVYSFGSNFQFDFEVDVMKKFQCEVHTFDPSKAITNKTKDKIPKNVAFHLIGLGNRDTVTNRKWKMRTLLTVMKDLNHDGKTIDILKMDIERGEWMALPQMIASGVLKRVKQLCIEFHFSGKSLELDVLRQVHDAGFLIFMRDRNLVGLRDIKGTGKITSLMELAFINVEYLRT